MKSSAYADQKGFSLIELLIVLLIIGVVTTFAIISFRGATVDLERQRIVREFKIYLERARFDSVKRRAADPDNMARITLNGPSSFTALIDFDNDGRLDVANETRVVDFASRSLTRIIVFDTLNYPVTLRFDQRGHVIARNGANSEITPVFTICSSNNCTAGSTDQTVLSISTAGTVAVLRDGETQTSPPAPNTNSNPPVSINCYVLVSPNSNTACPLN